MRYKPTSSDTEGIREFTGRYKIEICGSNKEQSLNNSL